MTKGGNVARRHGLVRQNVVFEFGFFIGALGPERVAALVTDDVERPSDLDGVVYISLDRGDWKAELGKELRAVGYTIDFNKVIGS
jgi:predicted nucleotide-binding protein